MSYRRVQVQPELWDAKDLPGRDAAIIFLDVRPTGDHGFVPIRLCKIVNWVAAPNATRVEVNVEFEDFVVSDSTTQASIRSLRGRPVRYAAGAKYYFALEDSPILRMPELSPADAWEAIAREASKTATLSDAVILSIGRLRHYGGGAECRLEDFRSRDKRYLLRPNTIYEMDVRVFDNSRTDLEIKSSTDLVAVAQAFPTTVGGVGSYRVLFSCKRTLETTTAVFSIDLAKSKEQAPGTVTSSRPVVLVQIAPSTWILVAFVLVAFAGLFFSSLSEDFFKANKSFGFGLEPVNAALSVKMAGSVLLALAAWLGFRKLPGGSA